MPVARNLVIARLARRASARRSVASASCNTFGLVPPPGDALFEQALRRYADNRVAGLSRELGDSGSASQRISRYFARLAVPENEAELRRGCFAANMAAELGRSDPAATKIVRRTFERMESVLEAALREGRQSGKRDDAVDPKAVASLLLATIIGIAVLARVDGSSLRTKRIARAVAALLNTEPIKRQQGRRE